ncbi:HSP20-like chaperone [Trametes cingulata]|nr:HSP20-like chaperone [Trametes cingulata]
MTARTTKLLLVSAVKKRLGRELTRDELHRLARAMRLRQPQQRIYKPRMELWDDGQSPTITAVFELPGLRADEILVDVVDGRLVVSGERRAHSLSSAAGGRGQISSAASAPGSSQVRELKYGMFRRTVEVPAGCTTSDLEATLENGMLTVSWPRHPVRPATATERYTVTEAFPEPDHTLLDSSLDSRTGHRPNL